MVQCVLSMPLRGLQGLFKRAQLPLSYPHYLCISKRVQTVNVTFKTKPSPALSQ
ncbi:Mobile element protein [Candidatus Enterovibrio altilux]|uniref:Mobile element protein n=1 Tax=Candidatus Enterovibrio altilux TaxID=1927128 RepID=A0A291B9W1_9GAMM|nr:Mobile element protein [Candidatus Enterovibrio luxaltus]